MKLWRLTRAQFVALDGQGALINGARYAPAGSAVVSLASEAGLAVLVALRYQPPDLANIPDDFVLGWTDIDASPIRIDDSRGEESIRSQVGAWLETCQSLLAAIRSKVLPEADVVYLNPAHPEAAHVAPLVCRPFSFAECLHRPPMLNSYGASAQ